MDYFNRKIDEIVFELAQWKARFEHEREWRKSVESEKDKVQEKYEQVVYELGTQKKEIERLEQQVKLLSSGRVEDVRPPERVTDTLSEFEDEEEELEMEEDVAEEEVDEPEHEVREERIPFHHAHHVYTNPVVHEARAGHEIRDAETGEPLPHIVHRYDPEFKVSEPPIDTRRGEDSLDDVLKKLYY